jgi:hypothetical protein
MGWIFLTVLAVILFWVGIGVWIYAKHRDEALVEAGRDPASESLMPSSIGLWAALGVVGLWILASTRTCRWSTVRRIFSVSRMPA